MSAKTAEEKVLVDVPGLLQIQKDIYKNLEEVYWRLDAALKALEAADFHNCECQMNVFGPILILKAVREDFSEWNGTLHSAISYIEKGGAR